MGNLTRSALLEFADTFDFDEPTEKTAGLDELGQEGDINNRKHSNHKSYDWAIYDENGELICKVPTQHEAILTRAEFRKIDKKEYGAKKNYVIKKVD